MDGSQISEWDRWMAAFPGWAMAILAGFAQDAENKARIAERKVIAEEQATRPRVASATTALAPGARPVAGGGYVAPTMS